MMPVYVCICPCDENRLDVKQAGCQGPSQPSFTPRAQQHGDTAAYAGDHMQAGMHRPITSKYVPYNTACLNLSPVPNLCCLHYLLARLPQMESTRAQPAEAATAHAGAHAANSGTQGSTSSSPNAATDPMGSEPVASVRSPPPPPGQDLSLSSKALNLGAGLLQNFAPLKAIHQHVCAFHM